VRKKFVEVLPEFATTAVHVVPALVDSSTRYPVTGEPPESVGAVHANDTCRTPDAVTVRPDGALGVVAGVVVAIAAAPTPALVTADTRTRYVVPLVKPSTDAVSVADVVVAELVHATPSIE
jgi:hypothetical protein